MSNLVFRFGRRVKHYRQKKKLSQEKLAERSGLHPTYIGQVERGEKNCTLETAEKIANGLEMSLTELLCDIPPADVVNSEPEIVAEIEAIVSKMMWLKKKQLDAISLIVDQMLSV